MSETPFEPIVTEAGQAVRLDAAANGFQIKITHIAFGSGGYDVPLGSGGKAAVDALLIEKDRVEIQDVRRVSATQKDLSCVLDVTQEYHIREVGIFLDDGTLYAVASHPTVALDWVSAATRNLFALELVIDDAPEVTIIASSGDLNLLMTREIAAVSRLGAINALAILRLEDTVGAHDGSPDPHPIYLTAPRGDARYYGRSEVDQIVAQAAAQAVAATRVPAGQGMTFAGPDTPPGGDLRCNGAAHSRTDHADLFAAIGTTYGAGDGATTFNVPDTRALFARDLDEGANIDTGRALGTVQDDAMQDHDHLQGGSTAGGLYGRSETTSGRYTGSDSSTTPYTSALSDEDGQVNARHADETRPKNIAFRWFIKT